MHELVRETVGSTIQLLFGLIANPEAIDKFANFFNEIGQRRFMMTVNGGKYQEAEGAKSLRGTIVTLSIYAGEGKFEIIQAFLPVSSTFDQQGRAWFTDCYRVGPESVVTVLNADIV